jgi:hypothetical protein
MTTAGPLQREEEPIDREIVREVIALTPETWRALELRVECSERDGIQSCSHVITSCEGRGEPVFPSDALFDATRRLGALFERHGRRWRTVTYRIELGEGDEARYTACFTYEGGGVP